jgi:hypothetical protein
MIRLFTTRADAKRWAQVALGKALADDIGKPKKVRHKGPKKGQKKASWPGDMDRIRAAVLEWAAHQQDAERAAAEAIAAVAKMNPYATAEGAEDGAPLSRRRARQARAPGRVLAQCVGRRAGRVPAPVVAPGRAVDGLLCRRAKRRRRLGAQRACRLPEKTILREATSMGTPSTPERAR